MVISRFWNSLNIFPNCRYVIFLILRAPSSRSKYVSYKLSGNPLINHFNWKKLSQYKSFKTMPISMKYSFDDINFVIYQCIGIRIFILPIHSGRFYFRYWLCLHESVHFLTCKTCLFEKEITIFVCELNNNCAEKPFCRYPALHPLH